MRAQCACELQRDVYVSCSEFLAPFSPLVLKLSSGYHGKTSESASDQASWKVRYMLPWNMDVCTSPSPPFTLSLHTPSESRGRMDGPTDGQTGPVDGKASRLLARRRQLSGISPDSQGLLTSIADLDAMATNQKSSPWAVVGSEAMMYLLFFSTFPAKQGPTRGPSRLFPPGETHGPKKTVCESQIS